MDVTPYQAMVEITGTLETPGDADNPKIIAWSKFIGDQFPEMRAYCAQYTHDAIAWCGLTQAYAMARAGIRPPYNPSNDLESFLWAQAWKKFGTAVVGAPQRGDVLVFASHVTMFDSQDGGYYVCRGGNQSDSVKLSRYRPVDCEAVRRPPAPSVKTGTVTPSQAGALVFSVRGKMSTFGGPNDTKGMKPDEGLAVFQGGEAQMREHGLGEWLLSASQAGASGLGRRLDPSKFYIACRWLTADYPILRDAGAVVTNTKTGKSATGVRPVDWGPNISTGRVCDMSPGLAAYLGLQTDDVCSVEVRKPGAVAPTQPVQPTPVKPTGLWAWLASLFTKKS